MKKSLLLGLPVFALVVVGCGGIPSADDFKNPYAGAWYPEVRTGTWTIGNAGDFTASIINPDGGRDKYVGLVDRGGIIMGTMYNTTDPSKDFSVSGTVKKVTNIEVTIDVTLRYKGESLHQSENYSSTQHS